MAAVRVHVPDAPIPTVELSLTDAARDFCRRTRAWRAWVETTTSVAGRYLMTLPAESQVVRIERVTVDDTPRNVTAFNWIEYDANGNSAADIGVVSKDAATLILTGPETTGAVKAQVSLMPVMGATGVDDLIADRYLEHVAAGAASRLLRMKGAIWYDPQAAGITEAEFRDGVVRACDDTGRSNTSDRARARINWC